MGSENKKLLSRIAFRYFFRLAAAVFIILTVAIAIDYIAYKHNYRFNLTERKSHSLSERSIKILEGLKEKVSVTSFYARDLPETALMRRLLGFYADVSPFFEYRILDTLRNPMEMQRYGVQYMEKVTVVEAAGNKEVVQVASEVDLTNAIVKVTTKGHKMVYFLILRKDALSKDIYKRYSKARSALENDGYFVKMLDWKDSDNYIPPDVSLLVVCAPDKDFGAVGIGLMNSLISQGGKILFLLDPFKAIDLNRFLMKHHVILKDDVVVDESSMLVGGDMFIPLMDPTKCGDHPIVSNVESRIGLPLARSVEAADSVPEEMSVETVLLTNSGAWTISKSAYDKWEFDFVEGKGKIGPVSVAVAVSFAPGDKRGRMVVIGDSDFVNDSYLDLFGGGNRDLFLNSVQWLVEGKGLIAKRPRVYQYDYLGLSEKKRGELLLTIVFLPVFVFIVGMLIYFRNKRRRL
jgi:ABC-type uncharacterized transport system involved in gliding motility auxiliary subunit